MCWEECKSKESRYLPSARAGKKERCHAIPSGKWRSRRKEGGSLLRVLGAQRVHARRGAEPRQGSYHRKVAEQRDPQASVPEAEQYGLGGRAASTPSPTRTGHERGDHARSYGHNCQPAERSASPVLQRHSRPERGAGAVLGQPWVAPCSSLSRARWGMPSPSVTSSSIPRT